MIKLFKKEHPQVDDPLAEAEKIASVKKELAIVDKTLSDIKMEIAKLDMKHHEASVDSNHLSSRIEEIGKVEALKSGIEAIDRKLAKKDEAIQEKETQNRVVGGKIDALTEVYDHGHRDQWICDKRGEGWAAMEALNNEVKQLYDEKWALTAERDAKQRLLDERRELISKQADLCEKCSVLATEKSVKEAQFTVEEARREVLSKQLVEMETAAAKLKEERREKEEQAKLKEERKEKKEQAKHQKGGSSDGGPHNKAKFFSFKRSFSFRPAATRQKEKKGTEEGNGGQPKA